MSDRGRYGQEPWWVNVEAPISVAHELRDGVNEQAAITSKKANARRIVVCINACAGIPDDVLEAGGIDKLVAAATAIFGDGSDDPRAVEIPGNLAVFDTFDDARLVCQRIAEAAR